jgi:hypothetical protein
MEKAWMKALCCVYTAITTTTSTTTKKASMKLYDGSSYDIVTGSSTSSSSSIMEKAYNDICKMGMGSQDCLSNSVCVKQALHDGTAPVKAPVKAPITIRRVKPTKAPTRRRLRPT